MTLCEYCNKSVSGPYPVHPLCAKVWLKGYHSEACPDMSMKTPTELTDFHDALLAGIIYNIGTVYWNKEQKQWNEHDDPKLGGIAWQSYVWCLCDEEDEDEDCPHHMPNFEFGGVEIRWYKYPGRGMTCNLNMTAEAWKDWYERCVAHIWSLDEKEF